MKKSFEAKHIMFASGISFSFAKAFGIHTKKDTEPRINSVLDVDADGTTNIPGIWATSTCAGVNVHIIITAGDGAKVAITSLVS